MSALLEWYLGWLLLANCIGFVGGTMHRALQQVAEKVTSS